MDYLQQSLKCCGVNSLYDWFDEIKDDIVPISCCRSGSNCINYRLIKGKVNELHYKNYKIINKDSIYTNGCEKVLVNIKLYFLREIVYLLLFNIINNIIILMIHYKITRKLAELLINENISIVYMNFSLNIIVRLERQNILLGEDDFWKQIHFGNIDDELIDKMEKFKRESSTLFRNKRLSVNNTIKLQRDKEPDIQAEVFSSPSQSNSGNTSGGASSGTDNLESSSDSDSNNPKKINSASLNKKFMKRNFNNKINFSRVPYKKLPDLNENPFQEFVKRINATRIK